METTQVLSSIQSDKENIQSDAPQRFPEAAIDGDYFRQGDVYIWKRDELPSGGRETKELQLVAGTTKGSRHILDSNDGVRILQVQGDALQGPWLHVTKERTITHPEHGDVVLPPGNYEITRQRMYAEELRAALD